MPAQQDIGAEQAALKTFGDTFGRMPQKGNAADWGLLHRMAYGSIDNLPDQYKNDPATLAVFNSSPKDAVAGANGAPPPAPLGSIPANGAPVTQQGVIDQNTALMNQAAKAKSDALNQYTGLQGQSNSFLSGIQQAIQMDKGYGSQDIGSSSIFNQAGLTGPDSMLASLAARKSEFDAQGNYLNDTLTNLNGFFQTQAGVAKSKYDDALNTWNKAQADLTAAQAAMVAHANAVSDLKTEQTLADKKAWYQSKLDNAQVDQYGNAIDDNGNIVTFEQAGSPSSSGTEQVTGMRTDRNDNPLAVSNADPEFENVIKAAGINVTTEEGADFGNGLKTLKFDSAQDGIEAARALLSNSPKAFSWYSEQTGKDVLAQYGITSNADFKKADKATQDAIIKGIYQNEGGSGNLFGTSTPSTSSQESSTNQTTQVIPPLVKPYAKTNSDGSLTFIDLSGVTGKAKNQYAQIAKKKGFSVVMEKNDAQDMTNIIDAQSNLRLYENSMLNSDQPNWVARDLYGAGLTALAQFFQFNPKLAASTTLPAITIELNKAIGGVGGLRGGSGKITLPDVSQTNDTNKKRIQDLRQMLDNRQYAILGINKVKVADSKGKLFYLPVEQLEEALSSGYTQQ